MVAPDVVRTAKLIVHGGICEPLPVTTQLLAAALLAVVDPVAACTATAPREAQHRQCGCPACLGALVRLLDARVAALTRPATAVVCDTGPAAWAPVEPGAARANSASTVLTQAGGVVGTTVRDGFWI